MSWIVVNQISIALNSATVSEKDIGYLSMNRHDCAPMKAFFTKKKALPTPAVDYDP
jgi:hypothetical protein